jgi:hypothetical protein
MYFEPSTKPSLHKKRGRDRRTDRLFFLVLLCGIAIGVALAFFIGYLLYFYGALPVIEIHTVPATSLGTPEFLPLCPTCPPPSTPTPAPTETPTATPDLLATATAACSTFQSQFPGTPCP